MLKDRIVVDLVALLGEAPEQPRKLPKLGKLATRKLAALAVGAMRLVAVYRALAKAAVAEQGRRRLSDSDRRRRARPGRRAR